MYVITLEMDGKPLRYWTGSRWTESTTEARKFDTRLQVEKHIRKTWTVQMQGVEIVRFSKAQ